MTVGMVLYYFLTKTRFGVMPEHGFVTSDMRTPTTVKKNRSRGFCVRPSCYIKAGSKK
jgi:hypothetical protein